MKHTLKVKSTEKILRILSKKKYAKLYTLNYYEKNQIDKTILKESKIQLM